MWAYVPEGDAWVILVVVTTPVDLPLSFNINKEAWWFKARDRKYECGAMVEWYWQGKTEVLGEKHYTASVVDVWMSMEHWWNDTDRGNQKYRSYLPRANLYTTIPIRTDLVFNAVFRCDSLDHGTLLYKPI
jgi:hypothetical protein